MELRSGYKRTEVGIIPNDWKVMKINDVCQLINGRGFKPFEWRKEGLPIIRIQNLNGSDDFNYFDGQYDKKIEVENGQLLFAWSGSRGTSFGPHIWYGEKALLNYHTWKIVINESEIDKSFFNHALKQLTKHIEENAHGASALVHTQKWEMEGFQFPVPSTKEEQSLIATALFDTDTLISNIEKLLIKKRNIKLGVIRRLLQPKKGWERKQLGVLGKVYGGLSGKSRGDFLEGKYPYIPFMNIMSNPIIDTGYLDYVNIESGENQNQALKGDLFFNGSSETPEEVGMCSVLLEDVPNLYLNSFCFGFRLNKEHHADGLYLSYFFRSNEGRKLFYSLAQGATRYNLSKSNFNKLEIPLPKPDEQIEIANILTDIDGEINALQNKLEKYRKVKIGMMYNLLTGKIRLV